ncbi:MAG: serine/threonine protein kinase, partial [Myxococcales bacterium]|nr:serine/threonine protein kinase [Myxococcales bacterium]
MLCYRCGGHVKDGAGRCVTCGQQFDPALKAGPAAGFGVGVKRPRAVEGAPCHAGDRIAGRYEVREHVGSGPLGWMYRAFEATNAGEVALKILSPRFLQIAEEKRVFVEELHKAQRLAHPNIARIYEAGEDGRRPFVAAQYLEGLTLRRIMDLRRQKGQRFTLQEVEPIAAQIAAALEAANTAFAHGNLKPDNVIVLPDLLKLTDFGLAVSLPRAPFMAAQKAAAAHRYLAPEFLLGEPLDARTDVFSLGVMLGEMLSGAQYDAQLSVIEKNPELPEAVEALFRRAVSPRPNARFPSAADLAAELSELLSAMPRPPPQPSAEDAGDVLIVEAQTDPRLRIARALGATRAPDPALTPPPPVLSAQPRPLPVEPFTPPPPYQPPPLPVAPIVEPPSTELQ